MMLPPPTGFGRRGHTATGVVVAARHCCVTGSCVAAGAIASVLDMTGRSQDAMVIPPDIEAQILRYYHAEKWTVGTIARQLHVHHSPRVKRLRESQKCGTNFGLCANGLRHNFRQT